MNNENQKPITIGKASFIDFSSFLKWCDSEQADDFFSIENLWTPILFKLQGTVPGISFSKLHDVVRSRVTMDGKGVTRYNREHYYLDPLVDYNNYIISFSTPESPLSFSLLFEHEMFDVISFADKQFLIPAGNLKKTLYKDYSDIPISRLHAGIHECSSGGFEGALVPSGSELSQVSRNVQQGFVDAKTSELAAITHKMDDVKNARAPGLAELQAEIDRKVEELNAKKEEMLAELNAKKAEMEIVKEKLERELYILDSEIYSIRCFLGEVVDFIQLRSGNQAPVDHPITLFQKIRFLDEELGKAISFYDFDYSDSKLFEELLKTNDEAVDLFCPNQKCVSLVRVAKSNLAFGYRDTPYGTMLTQYEVYHGKTIGILVRNGDNLYFGWTDDEKINISDDMFYTPNNKTVSSEDAAKLKSTSVDEAVSRYFIFSILQGVLENGSLFSLPHHETTSFSQPSKYIIFSAADAWLTDNKYGSFADLIKTVNSKIMAGDDILALTHLSDGQWRNNGWTHGFTYERDHNNSRRTHDVRFVDGAIYKINLVDQDEYGDTAYYVSLVKDTSPDYVYRNGNYAKRKRDAHARFRVYPDEFINLTYMNSVWLQYAITSKNLGSYGPGNKLESYAETIRYLNKALAFVKEREQKEQALIALHCPSVIEDPEWPVKLSTWKLDNNVRTITEYQAKRFAKWRIQNG